MVNRHDAPIPGTISSDFVATMRRKSPNRIARPGMPDNTVTFVPGGHRAPSAPRVEDRTQTVSDISQRTARIMPGGAADRDLPSSVSPPLSAELHHAVGHSTTPVKIITFKLKTSTQVGSGLKGNN